MKNKICKKFWVKMNIKPEIISRENNIKNKYYKISSKTKLKQKIKINNSMCQSNVAKFEHYFENT